MLTPFLLNSAAQAGVATVARGVTLNGSSGVSALMRNQQMLQQAAAASPKAKAAIPAKKKRVMRKKLSRAEFKAKYNV